MPEADRYAVGRAYILDVPAVYKLLQLKGAACVNTGRNGFRSQYPAAMIRPDCAMVHQHKQSARAFELDSHLQSSWAIQLEKPALRI